MVPSSQLLRKTASQWYRPARNGFRKRIYGVQEKRRAWAGTQLELDNQLGVIRIDKKEDRKPLATVWNFSIHGTSFDKENMKLSTDIMGWTSKYVEQELGGVVLFANGAEGNIMPVHRDDEINKGAGIIAKAIVDTYKNIKTSTEVEVKNFSTDPVGFGEGRVVWSKHGKDKGEINVEDIIEQPSNDSSRVSPPPRRQWTGWSAFDNFLNNMAGGFYIWFIEKEKEVKAALDVFELPHGWIEDEFRFQAIRLSVTDATKQSKHTLIVSVPGEATSELGLKIKAEGKQRGYDSTFVFGLANGHMSYIVTEEEWNKGGYEVFATFFDQAASRVLTACQSAMNGAGPIEYLTMNKNGDCIVHGTVVENYEQTPYTAPNTGDLKLVRDKSTKAWISKNTKNLYLQKEVKRLAYREKLSQSGFNFSYLNEIVALFGKDDDELYLKGDIL